MSQPESKLSREIMKALKLRGWFCFKVHGSAMMMSGLPDIIVCAGGRFFGLETKMPLKRYNTSPGQDNVRNKIKAAGGICEVVSSPAEAVDLIERTLSA